MNLVSQIAIIPVKPAFLRRDVGVPEIDSFRCRNLFLVEHVVGAPVGTGLRTLATWTDAMYARLPR